MTRPDKEMNVAAVHELGHAVVAASLGHAIHAVVVRDDYSGAVSHVPNEFVDTSSDRVRCELEMVAVKIAGVIAVERLGGTTSDHAWASGRIDVGQIAELKPSEESVRRGIQLAREIVDENAPLIRALAPELIRRRRIQGDEVERALSGVRRVKFFERSV